MTEKIEDLEVRQGNGSSLSESESHRSKTDSPPSEFGNEPLEVIGANPAVQVAQEGDEKDDQIIELTSGVLIRRKPIPDILMQRVMAKVEKPKVPMWFNPDKEREEPNPNDPDYLEAVRKAEEERGQKAIDAAIMFGCELVDDLPSDRTWIKRLKRFGIEVDETDEFELQFAYLKYVAFVNSDDLALVTGWGLSERDIENAGATFRRTKARRANRNRRAKESS